MPADTRQIVRWHEHADAAGIIAAAGEVILTAARAAIAKRSAFRIVLSGGETPRRLYRGLAVSDANWAAWHVYYGDERCVPVDDARRNSVMAARAWLSASTIPRPQIHPIPAELGPDAGAAAYSRELRDVGEFDVVLLGLGEDGHAASLFPSQDWGDGPGAAAALAVRNAPKPPSDRVSLSAWRLARTQRALVLVCGEAKREAVRKWKAGENLPIAAIAPAAGVDVFADRAATAPRAPG